MVEQAPIGIVALNGSPHRHGNTATLMGWVLEGCREAGARVEWLHVVDWDVRYCQGCFACLRTGVCAIQDDAVAAVRDRLLAADGLVVGSPVYAGQPSAQLKTLMDRLTLLNLYTHTFDRQRTVGVATSGVAPTGGVAKELAGFFGRPAGAVGAKTASVARGYQPLAQLHDHRLPARARALGGRLVDEIRSPRRPLLPNPFHLWIALLRRFLLRPMVVNHPEQFGGVLRIWERKGWV